MKVNTVDIVCDVTTLFSNQRLQMYQHISGGRRNFRINQLWTTDTDVPALNTSNVLMFDADLNTSTG